MFGLSKKENGLKIIIVGCGKVGANLVDQLSKEGHDITVIDKKAEKIQDITNILLLRLQIRTSLTFYVVQ